MKRTAKILQFVKRPASPPMTKECREGLVSSLLELAARVELGEISECVAPYVDSNGKTGHVYLLPRDPRKLLVAIDRSKSDLLKMIEEDGPRQ